MLEVIRADIDVALALTGHPSIAAVDRSALYQPPVPVAPA
jgi:isopentenyl diphosphate isomerase/L-lactate dehydrogenase-like FMN-dependent dehydrogenase